VGRVCADVLFRKTKNISVEPGSGFMVARIEREKKLDSVVGRRPHAPTAPQGVYLYGNVGCGECSIPLAAMIPRLSSKRFSFWTITVVDFSIHVILSYSGKTLLMDLFYKSADGVVPYRRRMHFHAVSEHHCLFPFVFHSFL